MQCKHRRNEASTAAVAAAAVAVGRPFAGEFPALRSLPRVRGRPAGRVGVRFGPVELRPGARLGLEPIAAALGGLLSAGDRAALMVARGAGAWRL